MVIVRAALASLLLCAVAHGQSTATPTTPPASQVAAPAANTDVDSILKRSANAVEHAQDVAGSGWQEHADALVKDHLEKNGKTFTQLQGQGQDVMRRALNDAAKKYDLPSIGKQAKPDAWIRYRVYASQSMGDAGLREVFEIAAAHPDMVISFRGMKPGQTLLQLSQSIAAILHKVDPDGKQVPAIEINPKAFSQANVTDAPTLEDMDKEGRRLAVVQGVTDPDWIKGQLADGRKGDLGTRGQVYPVVEEDMLAKIETAAKNFDYQGWADKAGKTYWKHAKFDELPPATQARQRLIDPTVEVKADIVTPDGKYIAHKGDRFNPLKDGPGFHQIVVVFDGTDPKQVAFVEKFVRANAQQKLTLITTGIDRDSGWDGFEALQTSVGRAVYLLNDLFQNTFHIEHVPSVVTANDVAFVVTEVPVDQGGGNAQAHATAR